MQANRDKTSKMGSCEKPSQQPNISHSNSVHGTMKPVMKENLSKMGLTKTGGENHRGKC